MTMHCTSELIDDYLSRELEPERDADVHTHLEACAECRARYEEAAVVRDWMRAAARAEEREFPPEIAVRLGAEIRSAAPSPLERLREFWRPMFALPVGAAVAAAIAFGLFASRPSNAPLRVAAAYYLQAHNAQAAANPLADRSTSTAATVLTTDTSASVPVVDAADVTSVDTSSATNP